MYKPLDLEIAPNEADAHEEAWLEQAVAAAEIAADWERDGLS